MPMYNLIEYSDIYLKTGSLWQYYRDELLLIYIIMFIIIIIIIIIILNSILFKFKQQITGQTENGGTKNVEVMVPFKYLSNF